MTKNTCEKCSLCCLGPTQMRPKTLHIYIHTCRKSDLCRNMCYYATWWTNHAVIILFTTPPMKAPLPQLLGEPESNTASSRPPPHQNYNFYHKEPTLNYVHYFSEEERKSKTKQVLFLSAQRNSISERIKTSPITWIKIKIEKCSIYAHQQISLRNVLFPIAMSLVAEAIWNPLPILTQLSLWPDAIKIMS